MCDRLLLGQAREGRFDCIGDHLCRRRVYLPSTSILLRWSNGTQEFKHPKYKNIEQACSSMKLIKHPKSFDTTAPTSPPVLRTR